MELQQIEHVSTLAGMKQIRDFELNRLDSLTEVNKEQT
jgi:hypothetical protein